MRWPMREVLPPRAAYNYPTRTNQSVTHVTTAERFLTERKKNEADGRAVVGCVDVVPGWGEREIELGGSRMGPRSTV